MSVPERLNVEYRLSPECYRDWVREHLIQQGASPPKGIDWKAMRHAALLSLLVLVGMIGCFEIMAWIGLGAPGDVAAPLILTAVISVFFVLGALPSRSRTEQHEEEVEQMIDHYIAPGALGVVRLRLTADGITYTCRFEESRFGWADLIAMERQWGMLGMTFFSGRQILIPIDALNGGVSIKQIESVIHKHWHRSEAKDRQAAAFLRDHMIECKKCDYEINGVNSCRCPECGTEFDIDDLKRAETATPSPLDG